MQSIKDGVQHSRTKGANYTPQGFLAGKNALVGAFSVNW